MEISESCTTICLAWRCILKLYVPTTMTMCPVLYVSEVYGSGVFKDATVDDVYRINCHGHSNTFAVEFFVNPKSVRKSSFSFFGLTESEDTDRHLYIQIAFRCVFVEPGAMHQRVLRVETLAVYTPSSPHLTWEMADANVIATLMFQKAVAAADDQGIGAARVLLFEWGWVIL